MATIAQAASKVIKVGLTLPPTEFDPIASDNDPFFASVILLQHYDGNFTDYSNLHQSFTAAGAATSSADAKFGQSLNLGGSPGGGGDNVLVSDAYRSEYDLSQVGDFTMEAWVRADSMPVYGGSARPIVRLAYADYIGYTLSLTGSAAGNTLARFDYDIGGGVQGMTSLTSGLYLPIGVWTHIAATREIVGALSNYYLWVGGQLAKAQTESTPGAAHTRLASIGNSPSGGLAHHGMIDEVRVTAGVARYKAPFVPRNDKFQNS